MMLEQWCMPQKWRSEDNLVVSVFPMVTAFCNKCFYNPWVISPALYFTFKALEPCFNSSGYRNYTHAAVSVWTHSGYCSKTHLYMKLYMSHSCFWVKIAAEWTSTKNKYWDFKVMEIRACFLSFTILKILLRHLGTQEAFEPTHAVRKKHLTCKVKPAVLWTRS